MECNQLRKYPDSCKSNLSWVEMDVEFPQGKTSDGQSHANDSSCKMMLSLKDFFNFKVLPFPGTETFNLKVLHESS